MNIYNEARYYEIAFDFVDIKKQVDIFEQYIKRYSRGTVRCVLDIGCGPGLQLRELARRGYTSIGLDVNSSMVRYLAAKAHSENVNVGTKCANMVDFRLREKIDFAFIMMGDNQLCEKQFRNAVSLEFNCKSASERWIILD